ncbi:hypothetical protein JS518_12200 [Clostridiales bacterium FE2010]|nr:hypothetical protein JS518_12200 [Clostridiales bacterium FE2010]
MENNENMLPVEKERQIQLVVNNNQDEGTIDLGIVFRNMKLKKRIFAWVLVLCLVVGVCAPLLLYQFTKAPLTVSSVVTLRYEAPVARDARAIREGKKTLKEAELEPVKDLTAPDGMELDLNQITSSYVLQTALDSMTLSKPITADVLRNNIGIQTVLTEESQRVREALAGLADAKNADAYRQLQTAEMKYENRFIVTLTNGFGDEDSRVKIELKDGELKLLLDRILTVYNEYLVRTYADVKLPDDAFSVIDTLDLDVLDSLDQLRAGLDDLYDYCNAKTDTIKNYRSWKTGRSLSDWMETLQTFKSINVDYLYAMVSENAITRDKTALLTGWKYMMRMAQNDLDQTNDNIAETEKLLKNYKNDEVFISMQESDAAKSTKTATEYYNNLILQQTEYYDKAAELKTSIADYEDRIKRLDAKTRTDVTTSVEEELARSMASAQGMYTNIRAHMEELLESQMYTTFEDHSAPQGKEPSFISANLKRIIIFVVLFAVLGCGLWFLAALAPEFSKEKNVAENGKEAAAK